MALSEKDPVKAYAREELNIDMDELVSPWQAAFSSLISFSLGASVPLVAGAFIRDPRVRSACRIASMLCTLPGGL